MGTRLEEYFRRKKYPVKLWHVHSDREGVSEPVELQVTAIEERGSSNYYHFTDAPHFTLFRKDETSTIDHGYGSGFGDLWHWTNYVSFSEEDAKTYYKVELERVTKTYLGKWLRKSNYKVFKTGLEDESPVKLFPTEKANELIKYQQYVELTIEEANELRQAFKDLTYDGKYHGLPEFEHIVEKTGLPKQALLKGDIKETLFKYRQRYPDSNFDVYRCFHCGRWHLGKLNRDPEIDTYAHNPNIEGLVIQSARKIVKELYMKGELPNLVYEYIKKKI